MSTDQVADGPEARRRPATVAEAKAIAHPLRQRILRLCAVNELTNKELAERLDSEPGTIHYHVKQLVDAGLLLPAPVRTGVSGALEKPYRADGRTWWISLSYDRDPDERMVPVDVFNTELREAGSESIRTHARFMLHLSQADIEELDRRIAAVLDEYVLTEDQRSDQPVHSGIFLIHRLAGQPAGDGAGDAPG